MTLADRDKALIWHPFTQEKTALPRIGIRNAQGAYLYDENGNALMDLISSWWVNLHGHAHPDIALAIAQQAQKLEHVIFAGFTHESAVTLCEQLNLLLPHPLSRFFFSDNGSTAVEVALKMAYQAAHNQNKKEKTLFLSFEGGYHGDTFGAMSVGIQSGFHDPFEPLLFSTLTLPFPHTWISDPHIQEKEEIALEVLDQYIAKYSHQIAALIVEPLIQGASGMRMCRPEFIKQVIRKVKDAGILVIFDEVMTGFGRTGTLFALEQIGETPDFLCLSKGLTGGFLPLALTVTTDEIYNLFLSDEFAKALSHGHSYTANPLGCAAGIASLNLLRQPKTTQAMKALSDTHTRCLTELEKASDRVHRIRQLGTIGAFDLNLPPAQMPSFTQACLKRGFLIRPLKQSVYLLPPYCTTPEMLESAYQGIQEILASLARR